MADKEARKRDYLQEVPPPEARREAEHAGHTGDRKSVV